ncbi:hypothetical protein PPL_01186 [Heterostelium album PN500]|uniref:Uncharacterized protein n=1 Tax=Heterostelium pallidum (strain ATCC 26659 / Pp 5 / PN500) TaxID=670386 RepID=D3AYC6_HETP5|nr:hypothetical protein PPL_01186 [Heterostelium album PN500]EFA85953.1 hypothetical protein PPL_01186 [Heterostelium album PN500]|eukprot:XP_020438059.1 hypothetical protein PPL_01186 [Heterostelium album PN500]
MEMLITDGSLFGNVTTLDLGIIHEQLPKLPSTVKSLTLHISIGSSNSIFNYNNIGNTLLTIGQTLNYNNNNINNVVLTNNLFIYYKSQSIAYTTDHRQLNSTLDRP